MASGCTRIRVIVDQLSKIAINLLCWNDIDSLELAQLFFEHIICKRGVPDNIVIIGCTQLISRFWTRVCSPLSTDHWLSTAIHEQTDGQTEHHNQMLEQYLRAFCNYEEDNWDELYPLAEFTYNYAVHASTRMNLFWANYDYHLVMQFKAPKQPSSLNSEIQADTFAVGLEESHQTLRKTLQEAQASQTKYAGGKEVLFRVGEKIWRPKQHFRTTRLLVKLDRKRTRPYTLSKVINNDGYKLDFSYTIWKHTVFHIPLLDRYTSLTSGDPPSGPQRKIVEDSDEWEVDQILDCKRRYRKFRYLVQWAGHNDVWTRRKPAVDLGYTQEFVKEFHLEHPDKPRRWLYVLYGGFPYLTCLGIPGRYEWCRHGFLAPTTGVRVSQCTTSAVRLLMSYWSVVGLIMSCGGALIGCVSLCGVSLVI